MSITADSLAADYRAITEACGLLDRSERGKLALTGAGAAEFLQGQVTNDVEGLEPGAGCYAAFLTPKGKMLGDLRILDAGLQPVARSASGRALGPAARSASSLAESGGTRAVQLGDAGAVPLLLLDTERIALQELFNMIRRFRVGYDVELHKRTLERGLLSLIGPSAVAVSGAVDLPGDEHAHVATAVAGLAVRAIRTDVGVDLLVEDPGALGEVSAALRDAGAVPVSEAAAECLRIERGRPRYGFDLDDTVIPQEAGLNARAVSFTKGCYVGQETVARLHYRGKPNRTLRGLALSAPARVGDELTLGERTVGRLSSVAVSPRFGPIALALVRREAENGAVVAAGHGLDATVVELPFG